MKTSGTAELPLRQPGIYSGYAAKYYSTAEQYKNGISQVGAVAAGQLPIVGQLLGPTTTTPMQQASRLYVRCAIQLLLLCNSVGYERKLNGWDNDKQHAVYETQSALTSNFAA